MMWSLVKRKKRRMRSWKECYYLIIVGEVIEIWISFVVFLYCVIEGVEVGFLEGGVDFLKGEVFFFVEKGIGVRV